MQTMESIYSTDSQNSKDDDPAQLCYECAEDRAEDRVEEPKLITRVSTAVSHVFDTIQQENKELASSQYNLNIYEPDFGEKVELTPTNPSQLRRVSVDGLENDGLYAQEEYLDPPPDGGYGWVCCFCVVVMNFATWGPNTSYGIFLSYFLTADYFPGATATDFALIGGLIIGLTMFLLPVSAVSLNVFGYKPTLACAIVLECVAFIASSFVRSIGALYVTYGVLLGISFGFIFGCNSVVLPGWFLKKRAFANGVTHIGVGLGGLVFSFAVHAMIDRTGNHKWAMRMLGVMSLVLNTVAMALVKVRKPANEAEVKKSVKEIFKDIYDPQIFKMWPVQLCTLWSSLTTIGYVIMLFSLSNYALSIGLSTQQATNTLAMFNGAQIIGRPAMGYFSERFGRVNFTILAMVYSLILIFPYWLNISSYAQVVPFSLLLGLGVGIGSVNNVPLIADVVGLSHFAAGLGYNNFWNGAVSLVAEIIGLNLRDYRLSKPYLHCQIFVGVAYFCGLLCLVPYREWKIRRMLDTKMNSKTTDEELRARYGRALEPGLVNYFKRAFYLVKA